MAVKPSLFSVIEKEVEVEIKKAAKKRSKDFFERFMESLKEREEAQNAMKHERAEQFERERMAEDEQRIFKDTEPYTEPHDPESDSKSAQTTKQDESYTDTSAKSEQDDEKKVTKEKAHEWIKDIWSINGDYPGRVNVSIIDAEGQQERLEEHFKAFDDSLDVKHQNLEFDESFDILEARFAVRDWMRDEVAAENIDKKEIDTILTDRANHVCNVTDAMYQQGSCDFSQCKFYDKNGNELNLNWRDDYDSTSDAVMYGLNTGLISCKMPNGKMFEMPDDEYMQNLDTYLKAESALDEQMAELEMRTASKMASMSFADKRGIAPDYVKDEDVERYIDMSIESASKDAARYVTRTFQYENGLNPNLEILKVAGLVEEREKSEAIQRKNQQAMSRTKDHVEKKNVVPETKHEKEPVDAEKSEQPGEKPKFANTSRKPKTNYQNKKSYSQAKDVTFNVKGKSIKPYESPDGKKLCDVQITVTDNFSDTGKAYIKNVDRENAYRGKDAKGVYHPRFDKTDKLKVNVKSGDTWKIVEVTAADLKAENVKTYQKVMDTVKPINESKDKVNDMSLG